MSDTTAFVAGCATTGVAVLVLLVAKVGGGSAQPAAAPEPVEPVPTVPVPAVPSPEPEWEDELRQDLQQQRDLVSKLEAQLAQQEVIAQNLENQLRQQQEESRAVVAQLGEYQRSVDTLSLRNDQLVQTRRDEGLQTTLLWVGGGVILVLIVGGGAVMLCMVFMATQANRRPQPQPMSVVYPLQMPTPPSYRYYEQEFLPPAPQRARRVEPYPNYDYDA